MTLQKRIVAVLMALCMLIATIPDGITYASAATTEKAVSSEADIIAAITAANDGDSLALTLGGDVNIENRITVDKHLSLTINGDGHTIRTKTPGTWHNGGEDQGIKYNQPNWVMMRVENGSLTLKNLTMDAREKCQILQTRIDVDRVKLENCTFRNGALYSGLSAGVEIYKRSNNLAEAWYDVEISGCTFENNRASPNTPTSGGALYIGYGRQAYISKTTFQGNEAHSGGAFYAYQSRVYSDSTVKYIGNSAGQRGGAIHSHGKVFVDGSQFEGNKSSQYGGTIYISSNKNDAGVLQAGIVMLRNIAIEGSQASAAGGAIFVADLSELDIADNVKIRNNTVPDTDPTAQKFENNVYVSTSTGKICLFDAVTSDDQAAGGGIGVSTGNPYTHKTLVYSTAASTFVDQQIKEYTMSVEPKNYDKFGYDGEGWSLAKADNPDTMWLVNDASTGGTVIFDYNVPGNAAKLEYNKPIGTTVGVPSVSPQNVEGVRFIFRGWYDAPEGGTQITADTVTVQAGPHIYYAQWDLITEGGGGGASGTSDMYLVYFDYNYEGGGVTSAYSAAGTFTWTVTDEDGNSEEFEAKLPFGFPEDPLRPGYKFGGWATSPTSKTPVGSTWQPTKTDTLYGIWEAETHTLTWDANGGQGGTTTTQEHGTSVAPPTTEPTREGYRFNGWYIDANCTVPLDAATKVIGNQTFYASWLSEKVIVTYYDTRESTTIIGKQEYNYGDNLMPLDPMTDTSGQTFVRWETKDGQPATGIGTLTNAVLTYHKGGNGGDVSSDAGYWTLDIYAVWAQETTDYVATIKWDDLQNNDGCRPKSVHLGLISSVSNRLVADAIVTDDGNDTQPHTFTDLPITTADSSVEKITYSVFMLGYTDAGGTYREIKDTSASSGELIGSTASKYDDAVSTTYRYAINNYTTGATAAEYSGSIYLDHDLITTGEDVDFSIQWEDQSDNDGKRPGGVTLVLYADGVAVKDRPLHNSGTGVVSASPSICEISKDGGVWTYVWRDYQKYNNGAAINYTTALTNNDQTVKFNENDYTTKYLNSDNDAAGDPNGAIVSRDIELVDKTVTVKWDDESNRDKLRPETITVTLTADQWNNKTYRWEEKHVGTADIAGGANNTWTHTFPQIKKYNGGQEIIYRAAITSDLNAHIPDGANGYTQASNDLTITASHNRNVRSVPVKIEWDDVQNNDKIRPSIVIVQLYADGRKLDGADHAVLLNGDAAADTWEYTFDNLPFYCNGKEGEEILYTISVEEAVKDSLYGTYISTANGQEEEIVRYTASYMNAAGETTGELAQSAYAYAKLTHSTDQGTINLYASWHDEQNRDGRRPSSIQVDLYRQVDGDKQFVKTYTVTAGKDNSWTYKVSGLPLYENGYEVKYLVDVSEDFRQNLQDTYGYTVSMEGSKPLKNPLF